jgi:hypothetical protein
MLLLDQYGPPALIATLLWLVIAVPLRPQFAPLLARKTSSPLAPSGSHENAWPSGMRPTGASGRWAG